MQGDSAINVFSGGMSGDIDILNTDPSTYRDSMNGRLMFNKDGTYSWETENGSKISFTLTANGGADSRAYKILGNTGNDNIRIIWSHYEDASPTLSNSEIGIFSINEAGIGQYKTLFNDVNDPNGDKLAFLYKNQIEARFVYENPKIIRCYWIDGIAIDSNRPRVITMSFDEGLATPVGNESDVNAYSVDNPSVFGMNSQTNFKMGLLKYVKNVGGGLLSGVYQYTYSLGTKEGYNTPWYPPTRRVFVANAQVDSSNWHKYQFSSGGVSTSKGNQVQIKGIDQRYDRIRVAYIYSVTSSTVVHSKIFLQTKVDKNPGGDTMTFDHVGNIGEPLLTSEIADIFSGILGAKTLNIKDSTLYYGNIKENILQEFDLEPILKNLTITPFFKDMRSDEGQPGVSNLTRPITHQYPKTGITQIQQHDDSGGTEDYVIDKDYVNYKGTQIDHSCSGYFRAETYRMAIVFFDLLGFESFSFHLADIQMPNITGVDYEWNRIREDGSIVNFQGNLGVPAWQTNNYNYDNFRSRKVLVGDVGQNYITGTGTRSVSHLKIMGLKFGGIDISSIKNLISGFKIVRAPRDKTILLQGSIMPCVGTDDNEDGPVVLPLPSTHQNFYDFGQSSAPNGNSIASDVKLEKPFAFHNEGTNPDDRYFVRPNTSVMYAPAINFGTAGLPNIQSEDQVKIVGCAWDTYNDTNPNDGTNTSRAFRATAQYMWYGKHYNTWNDWHKPGFSTNPFPRYESYMEGIVRVDLLNPRGFIEDWILNTAGGVRLNNDVTAKDADDNNRSAHGAFSTIYMNHGNFIPTSSSGGTNDFSYAPLFKNGDPSSSGYPGSTGLSMEFMGHLLFNWVRPNPQPYGGLTLSSLETTIFYGTGHFQPINNVTFDAQGMPADNIFNGIEVWGGDCFLDYISHMRMYPHSKDLDDDDYSDGRIFPWENEYNHTMRFAGTAGGVGTYLMLVWTNVMARPRGDLSGYPASAHGLYSGDSDSEGGPTGVFEEFHINDALNFQELTEFYNPKPINFLSNDIFPVRWRYSPDKIYGDPIDTWRTFQVNDFRDLNGRYGEITSSLYIFNQIYSWQVSAFGRLRASDRALIESENQGSLSTGVGDKLDGVDYISTEFGNQHQWSLFASNSAAYWVDVNKRKIMKFAQDGQNPLSDIKGQHQYLEQELPLFEDYDNPVLNRGVHGVFDFGNNEAIFTFNRDRYLYPDDNNNIVLVSRSELGKTYSPYIVEQNQSAVLSSTSNGQSVYLPNGNIGVGINENTILYLMPEPNAYVTFDVYNVDNSGISLLFTASPGKYYRCFRHGINDAWMYEEVLKNDTTPHKESLTYSEYGNWFSSYHSYSPTAYIGTKFVVMSQDSKGIYNPIQEVMVHDMGLKAHFPSWSNKSYFTISVNESPMVAKSFDSLRINCNEDANNYIDTILMLTETQFYFMDMTTDTRKKYLEDVLRVPLRAEDQQDRMRGKHLSLTVELKNNTTFRDRITNLVAYFRTSKRF
jgi:hypothetical protein